MMHSLSSFPEPLGSPFFSFFFKFRQNPGSAHYFKKKKQLEVGELDVDLRGFELTELVCLRRVRFIYYYFHLLLFMMVFILFFPLF